MVAYALVALARAETGQALVLKGARPVSGDGVVIYRDQTWPASFWLPTDTDGTALFIEST